MSQSTIECVNRELKSILSGSGTSVDGQEKGHGECIKLSDTEQATILEYAVKHGLRLPSVILRKKEVF